MTVISQAADMLWRNAWSVVPLALLVMSACRFMRFRPATRHVLLLVVLLGFVVPLVIPGLPMPACIEGFADWASLPTSNMPDEVTLPPDLMAPIVMPVEEPTGRVGREPPARANDPGDSATPSPPAAAAIESRVLDWLPAPPSSIEPPPVSVPLEVPIADLRLPGESESTASGRSTPLVVAETVTERHWEDSLPHASELGAGRRRNTADTPALPARSDPHDRVVRDIARPDRDAGPAVVTPSERPDHWWRGWVVWLAAWRQIVARLPPVPVVVWAGGFALLILWHVFRYLLFGRRLRRAVAAPAGARLLVAEAAEALELRRAPDVVMIDDCVSPMIWCGRRLRVVLPSRLWAQLDPAGRRAIVYHELAHLRRLDHWVCWLALAVSAVYWWHPLAWWVRRRLHEEAELCCDAWVTWLMPERRRAYAEALLHTKAFVGRSGRFAPAGGMGVTSAGARRLARRITMVMTESARPGVSASGAVLALVVALVGWVTVPGWASPGDSPGRGVAVPTPTVEILDEPTPTVVVMPGASVPDDDAPRAYTLAVGEEPKKARRGSLEKRLDELEKKLQMLSDQLTKLQALDPPAVVPHAPLPPAAAYVPYGGTVLGGAFWAFDEDSDEVIVCSYELPKGKLELLSKLMIRDDVPVPVSLKDDCIEVHAAAEQHQRFAAFVELIHPTGVYEPRGFSLLSGSKDSCLDELSESALEHHAQALELYQSALGRADKATQRAQLGSGTKALLKALSAQRRESLGAIGEQMVVLRALKEHLRRLALAREEQAAVLEAEADSLIAHAEELRHEAEAVEEEAETLESSTEEVDNPGEIRQYKAQIRALQRKSKEMERQSRQIERRVDELRKSAQRLEHDAQELQESADQLDEALEALSQVSQAASAEEATPAGETR